MRRILIEPKEKTQLATKADIYVGIKAGGITTHGFTSRWHFPETEKKLEKAKKKNKNHKRSGKK